ncbi:class I SAM-dependent methyltransferase [Paenibacillus pabuli]|uniref:class I SAM-dependent methyltransferase n=1 Tax=Paenibacillus pabuli TaxID=1472 RepID=UPI001FFE380B|nr:methyltransferase domain-containing protein [Paenibacillus pabuli]UPK41111.1 methyltransferase domain-containing protein [Paenibacillus pabuli]
MKLYNYLLLLLGFLRNPKRVGSVIPSSKWLAQKVVSSVPWNEVKSLAELGSGTGAITRLIQRHMADSTNIFLFERDPGMRKQLNSTSPHFQISSNASYLYKKITQEDLPSVDCVICGLPFFNFSNEMRQRILDQIQLALKPGGTLIVYQFSLQMKRTLNKHFTVEDVVFVPFNFPPAFVYVCRKRNEPNESY